jgi:hypothetical protein
MTWLEPHFAQAETKVVIFSAWIATHELVATRLDALGIGYVLFNGLVPARERAQRVERFRDDPRCRVFLATDAGGVGLNLQHIASVLVNMDLPWNPAVLEQRIGRVWRLGQTRRVEVLNLVASDSIEQSMLGVLQFKRSLFEGVLEGGDGEIHLEGTRLSRFMRSVEALTDAASADTTPIAASVIAAPTAGTVVGSAGPPPTAAGASADHAKSSTQAAIGSAPADFAASERLPISAVQTGEVSAALQPLLAAAAQWLGQLAGALGDGEAHPQIERDPASGRASLRLPLPEPDLLRKLADTLEALRAKP